MKQIVELQRGIRESPELRSIAMDMVQFMFTKSQENLVIPMPWGDEIEPSNRKPTAITDTSLLLISGIPPYWEGENTIVFEYSAPHAGAVEYGSDPQTVELKKLVGWVNRKLGKKGGLGLYIARKVVDKIKKKGIPPHPYIRPAANAMEIKYGLKRK